MQFSLMGIITCWFCSQTLCDDSLVFQIDVPTLCLAGFVLECECEDSVAVFDCVLSVGIRGLEGIVDGIESL